MENAVAHTRSAGRTGILVAQGQVSSRHRAVTNLSHSHTQTQTHDASSARNRARRSIEAFTRCDDDISVHQPHLPQVVTKSEEKVTRHAASGYPIVRLASCGHAGDHIELGTERSVPVYGMSRRSRDRESQSDTQTCKSIGDPVHEATITLRVRQIPRVKRWPPYECTTCGNGPRPRRQPASYRRNNPVRHMVAAVMVVVILAPDASLWSRRHDLSHTCIPNIVHTMAPHFLQRGYDAKALVAA